MSETVQTQKENDRVIEDSKPIESIQKDRVSEESKTESKIESKPSESISESIKDSKKEERLTIESMTESLKESKRRLNNKLKELNEKTKLMRIPKEKVPEVEKLLKGEEKKKGGSGGWIALLVILGILGTMFLVWYLKRGSQ